VLPVEAAPTATRRSDAFVVVTEDVDSEVVAVPSVKDPLALWSTLQVKPEYSAIYKFESPPLPLESAAVTVKLVPVDIPGEQ
jgi:hypothetical protein